MIDGFRRSKPKGGHIRPTDRHLVSHMVVGKHADDTSRSSFKPPQEVEATEEQQPATNTATPIMHRNEVEKKRSFKEWLKARTKKQWIIFGIVAAVVLAGLGVGAYFLFKSGPPAAPVVAKKEEPKAPPPPTTVASNLTGLQVDPPVNDRPVTGIMIENSPDARPQSALDQAGVVFEAIAEGGITRFLTLFQDTEPEYIGPVRSVRPYYVQWAMGFDAAVAHVGGSEDGLALVRTAKDLDQFAGSAYFWRISSRYAPHNVYTSISKLHEYESAKGYGKSNYTSLPRKAEQPSATPNARGIDFNISGALYNAHYDYDQATNSYKRSEGGAPHMSVDLAGNQVQITPKVVVGLVMPQGLNGKYTTYQTIGSGHMYVFQDGIVTEGTWKKDGNSTQFTFTDGSGQPLKLNPGQTWFTAIGSNDRVTHTP